MGNNYIIPFGIDANPLFEGLNKIDQGVDNLAANTAEANKAMQKGFGDAAAASDKLGDKMQENAAQAATLKSEAKALGKELGDALSGKGVSGDIDKKLSKFSDMLAAFSKDASKPIKFNIDAAKLAEFEKLIESGVDDMEILKQVTEAAAVALSTLDPKSEEFAALNAQVQIAEGFMQGLSGVTEAVTVKQKSLKTQLKEVQAQLNVLAAAGKNDTQEFKALAQQAGELKDAIGDVGEEVKVFASDTKYIEAGVQAVQALSGAFAVGQAAAALFGEENEEVNKVMQKLTAANTLLQGVQAISNALSKQSALSVLLLSGSQATATVTTQALAAAQGEETVATVAATTATVGLNTALLANPIVLVVAAVAALVAGIALFISGSNQAVSETERLNSALRAQEELLDLDEKAFKRRTDLLVAQAKAAGKSESEITTLQGEQLAKQINARKVAYDEFIAIYNNQSYRQSISLDENNKLEEKFKKFTEQRADDLNELEIKKVERDGQRRKEKEAADKKAADAAKKLADDAKKAEDKRLAEEKKAAEERKKIKDQELKFANELEKAKVDTITNGFEKERAQARAEAATKIADLQNEKSLSKKAEQEKQELITVLRGGLLTKLKAIDKKEADELAALQLKAQGITNDLRKDGIDKEIESIKLGFDEKRAAVIKEFTGEKELREKLIALLNEGEKAAVKKATNDATNEKIKLDEERAVLEVETATKFLPDLPGIEKAKQLEILKVKVDFAQKALDALIGQGEAENSIAVLQAKKQVQELQKQLGIATKEAAAEKGQINWFSLLGLGELSQEDRDAVTDAAKKSLDSVREITGFIIDQYQQQIDKKQEVIDQIDNSIDDLQDQLDKEQSLKEQGFANNVDIIQAELDAKKKAKEDEVKQAEELQAKQAQIAKAQLVLDTIVQASNLITAATKIFSSLASIPFVGIPLAIVTVGLMTGAFVAAKVKAFQLVNQQKQAFGAGGWIDGPSHSKGGKKYQSVDGTGGVVELEGDEFVTNKRQSAKYARLLEAINNDDLRGMNDDALKAMLQGMGITLSSDAPEAVIKVVRQRDEQKHAFEMSSNSDNISQDVKTIQEGVTYLAQKERARVERWEDEQFYYTKEGNRTTKIKK